MATDNSVNEKVTKRASNQYEVLDPGIQGIAYSGAIVLNHPDILAQLEETFLSEEALRRFFLPNYNKEVLTAGILMQEGEVLFREGLVKVGNLIRKPLGLEATSNRANWGLTRAIREMESPYKTAETLPSLVNETRTLLDHPPVDKQITSADRARTYSYLDKLLPKTFGVQARTYEHNRAERVETYGPKEFAGLVGARVDLLLLYLQDQNCERDSVFIQEQLVALDQLITEFSKENAQNTDLLLKASELLAQNIVKRVSRPPFTDKGEEGVNNQITQVGISYLGWLFTESPLAVSLAKSANPKNTYTVDKLAPMALKYMSLMPKGALAAWISSRGNKLNSRSKNGSQTTCTLQQYAPAVDNPGDVQELKVMTAPIINLVGHALKIQPTPKARGFLKLGSAREYGVSPKENPIVAARKRYLGSVISVCAALEKTNGIHRWGIGDEEIAKEVTMEMAHLFPRVLVQLANSGQSSLFASMLQEARKKSVMEFGKEDILQGLVPSYLWWANPRDHYNQPIKSTALNPELKGFIEQWGNQPILDFAGAKYSLAALPLVYDALSKEGSAFPPATGLNSINAIMGVAADGQHKTDLDEADKVRIAQISDELEKIYGYTHEHTVRIRQQLEAKVDQRRASGAGLARESLIEAEFSNEDTSHLAFMLMLQALTLATNEHEYEAAKDSARDRYIEMLVRDIICSDKLPVSVKENLDPVLNICMQILAHDWPMKYTNDFFKKYCNVILTNPSSYSVEQGTRDPRVHDNANRFTSIFIRIGAHSSGIYTHGLVEPVYNAATAIKYLTYLTKSLEQDTSSIGLSIANPEVGALIGLQNKTSTKLSGALNQAQTSPNFIDINELMVGEMGQDSRASQVKSKACFESTLDTRLQNRFNQQLEEIRASEPIRLKAEMAQIGIETEELATQIADLVTQIEERGRELRELARRELTTAVDGIDQLSGPSSREDLIQLISAAHKPKLVVGDTSINSPKDLALLELIKKKLGITANDDTITMAVNEVQRLTRERNSLIADFEGLQEQAKASAKVVENQLEGIVNTLRLIISKWEIVYPNTTINLNKYAELLEEAESLNNPFTTSYSLKLPTLTNANAAE